VRLIQQSPTANPKLVEAARKFAQRLKEKEGDEKEHIDYIPRGTIDPACAPKITWPHAGLWCIDASRCVRNCPFDIFTIYDCGFYPQCALEAVDREQLRFQKSVN
jgi:hypothetical protein